jgi:hypothetical protein
VISSKPCIPVGTLGKEVGVDASRVRVTAVHLLVSPSEKLTITDAVTPNQEARMTLKHTM